jgi:hypothetical protein
MTFCGMLRRVALVRTDVSEELSTSFIRVARIGELGTTLAVTNNRRTLRVRLSTKFGIRFRRQVAVDQSVYFACGLKATECKI